MLEEFGGKDLSTKNSIVVLQFCSAWSLNLQEDPTSRATVEMVINGSFQTLSLIKETVAKQEIRSE